jgi:hypothetical protein
MVNKFICVCAREEGDIIKYNPVLKIINIIKNKRD